MVQVHCGFKVPSCVLFVAASFGLQPHTYTPKGPCIQILYTLGPMYVKGTTDYFKANV